MKRLLVLLISTLALNIAFSQALHTPDQILKITEASKITYEIDSVSREMKAENYPLIEKGTRTIKTGGKISLVSSSLWTQEIGEKYRKKINNFISRGNFEKAKNIYEKLLTKQPENEVVIQQLARICDNLELNEEAIQYYERLLDKNPVDFELHQKLSTLYKKQGIEKKAIGHAVQAHLMNRNDKKLREFLITQLRENGKNFENWEFLPKYKQIIKRRGHIILNYQGAPWLAYGLCKSVWEFESAYKENMINISSTDPNIIEEKECLLNGLLAYNDLKKDKDKYPEFKGLAKALANKLIDEYIYYEINAKNNPWMLLKMEESQMDKIIQYLNTLHIAD